MRNYLPHALIALSMIIPGCSSIQTRAEKAVMARIGSVAGIIGIFGEAAGFDTFNYEPRPNEQAPQTYTTRNPKAIASVYKQGDRLARAEE